MEQSPFFLAGRGALRVTHGCWSKQGLCHLLTGVSPLLLIITRYKFVYVQQKQKHSRACFKVGRKLRHTCTGKTTMVTLIHIDVVGWLPKHVSAGRQSSFLQRGVQRLCTWMQTITQEQKEQKYIGSNFSVHGCFATDINEDGIEFNFHLLQLFNMP